MRLFIIDGHSSHLNMKFMDFCEAHRIVLGFLPPHSTHRLQPLDVGVRRSDGSRLSYLARDGGEPPTYRPRPELGPSSIVSTCSHAACNPRTVGIFSSLATAYSTQIDTLIQSSFEFTQTIKRSFWPLFKSF